MSFPSTPLTVLVELALGADLTADPGTWVWTDATALGLIYTRDSINITRGRQDESSTADPWSVTLTVDNRGGYWSSRNPSSPWYGQLRKGTPIRVSAEGHIRFAGYITTLPPRWDLSGNDRYAQIEARGLLYQLTQGSSPARSALTRTILADAPVAFWALDDGASATSAASGLPGGSPLVLTAGAVLFQGVTPPAGAAGAVHLSREITSAAQTGNGPVGALSGPVTPVTSPTSWTVEFGILWHSIGAVGDDHKHIVWATPGGTFDTWAFGSSASGGVQVPTLFGRGPSASTVFPFASGAYDFDITVETWIHVVVVGEQVGSDVHATVWLDGVIYDGGFGNTVPLIGHTLAGISQATASAGADPATSGYHNDHAPAVTGLAIYQDSTIDAAAHASAMLAYIGEQAHVRFGRLCAEEGIAGTTAATESQAMGAQAIAPFLELLATCEATDQAYMYEGTDFGLVFQGHVERENLVAALELDYASDGHIAEPFGPVDDDQNTLNDVTVERDGGSSSRLTEEDPAVELSIPNVGRRDDSQTYSLATDDQTLHLAGWRLHERTWAGYRYPSLTLNFQAAALHGYASLIDDFCTGDLAFLATVANPPDDIGPDEPAVIIEGYAETLGLYTWDVQANCTNNGPWHVGVLAADAGDTDAFLGHLDWDSCEVHQATVTTGAASFTVDTTPLMTTTSDDFPFDVTNPQGERMTITGCTGSSNPQTVAVTRAVNGVTSTMAAGDALSLHPDDACYLGL